MVSEKDYFVNKGKFELYYGCMKSGKSRELANRIDRINFRSDADYICFKPSCDVRNKGIYSRLFGNLDYECILIEEDNPRKIFDYVSEKHRIIVIDELMFFHDSIVKVIKELLEKKLNVIAAGLDTDFRGEFFGPMEKLLEIADFKEQLYAICDYKGCNELATRTQRLINNKPAPYNSPLITIEGEDKNETYECRCREHHFVPVGRKQKCKELF